MRTKTLLLTAALSAAGVASTMAQVYSVNAVGYVNVKVRAGGFQIIANPLNAADNKLSALLPNVPDDTTIYKYNGTSYDSASFVFGEWDNPNMTLNPGEGAFIKIPGSAEQTLTFVGEVLQGAASNLSLNKGFNLVGSKVPQAGKLQTDLKYTPAEDDTVYKYNATTQAYASASFVFGEWDPADPTIEVGEGFFLQRANAGTWDRNFSVN